MSDVVNHRLPCSTPGCEGITRTRVRRDDIREDGTVVGVKRQCRKCRLNRVGHNDKYVKGYKGRKHTGIVPAGDEERFGIRTLTSHEVAALEKIYKPPLTKEERRERRQDYQASKFL